MRTDEQNQSIPHLDFLVFDWIDQDEKNFCIWMIHEVNKLGEC
jgi:hypothetical protein